MLKATLPSTRRSFLQTFGCGCLALAAARTCSTPALAAHGPHTEMTAEQALAALRDGNANFVADRPVVLDMGQQRRSAIAKAQTPFAVIVGCSDSRVSPELLFDRGLGALFTIRVAGNSIDRNELGSIEYAVSNLGCPLVVVLGHQRCGAALAALQAADQDTQFPGAIGDMVAPIIPAVLRAHKMPGDLIENVVRENVRSVAHRLRGADDVMGGAIQKDGVKVVGAYYRLDDGSVDFFDGV